VATSASESASLLKFRVPEQKIRLIPSGSDLPPCGLGPKNSSSRGITVLTVSRLTRIRNLEMLIRGFAAARKRVSSLTLTIAGGAKPSKFLRSEFGYETQMRALSKELSVADSVNFLGWVYGDDLWSLYASADIFAWTSRYESFGQSLVEAAYFGLPIVSTPVGVAEELIGRNEGGILVPHDDTNSLASALVQLALDETTRLKIRGHNHRVSLTFSSQRMTDAYIDLYHRLTK
jgi:glycosyltransferase involved in cell wall biosynthesis